MAKILAYLVTKPTFFNGVLRPVGSVIHADAEEMGDAPRGLTPYSPTAVVEASKPSTADAGQGPKATKAAKKAPVAGTAADAAKVTEAAKATEVKVGGTPRTPETNSADETASNVGVEEQAKATADAMVAVEAKRFPDDLADTSQPDGMVVKRKLVETANVEGVEFNSDHNKSEIMTAIIASRTLRVDAANSALS